MSKHLLFWSKNISLSCCHISLSNPPLPPYQRPPSRHPAILRTSMSWTWTAETYIYISSYKSQLSSPAGCSELVIRTQQQGLFIVPPGAEVAVAAGQGRAPASLQRGLLGVLLIGGREVMDGILDHVSWIHGLLQAARDAFHGSTATCVEEKERPRWVGGVWFRSSRLLWTVNESRCFGHFHESVVMGDACETSTVLEIQHCTWGSEENM